MKLGEYTPSALIKALVFGRFKVGKTVGAGTFPRPNWMDFDRGIASLLNPEIVAKHGYRPNIQFEQFWERNKDRAGVVRAHNAFDDACRYFDACMSVGITWQSPNDPSQKMEVGRSMFDTWVVDSGTTLSEYALNKAIILMGGAGMPLGIKSATHTAAINTGVIYPKMQDYGAERDMVERFIQMLLDTDKNVLFLCHERELMDDAGNLKAVVPLLTGKGVEAVPLKFDEVWNVQRQLKGPETQIILKTAQTTTLKVGSRLGIPDGTLFEYPVIRKTLDALTEQRTATMQSLPTAASVPQG